MWTLDELVDRVRAALDADGFPGVPSGRVRDLPDRRAVRWYQTTGLVDRPADLRGRVAVYGPRHLLQLVAVKRRQAEGRTLAEIQAELAGATDDTLAAVARVPAELLVTDPAGRCGPARPRFWAAAAPAGVAAAAPAATPAPVDAPPAAAAARLDLVTGVPLGDGVVLLVPGHPGPADIDAIHLAARPLIEVLVDRRLLTGHHRGAPHPLLTDDEEPSHTRAPRTHRSSS